MEYVYADGGIFSYFLCLFFPFILQLPLLGFNKEMYTSKRPVVLLQTTKKPFGERLNENCDFVQHYYLYHTGAHKNQCK